MHVVLLLFLRISMLLQLWLKTSSSSCPWNENMVVSWLAEMSFWLEEKFMNAAFSCTLLIKLSFIAKSSASWWYSFSLVCLRKLEHNSNWRSVRSHDFCYYGLRRFLSDFDEDKRRDGKESVNMPMSRIRFTEKWVYMIYIICLLCYNFYPNKDSVLLSIFLYFTASIIPS